MYHTLCSICIYTENEMRDFSVNDMKLAWMGKQMKIPLTFGMRARLDLLNSTLYPWPKSSKSVVSSVCQAMNTSTMPSGIEINGLLVAKKKASTRGSICHLQDSDDDDNDEPSLWKTAVGKAQDITSAHHLSETDEDDDDLSLLADTYAIDPTKEPTESTWTENTGWFIPRDL